MSRPSLTTPFRFVRSRHGNVAVTFVLLLVPLTLAVGMASDYGAASTERSDMQNALDAAVLSALLEPDNLTQAARQAKLSQFFAANGGKGTATIVNLTSSGNELSMKATASWAMPTNFMMLANIRDVQIGVESAAKTSKKIEEATFRFDNVWGDWSKDIVLKGASGGAEVDLMRMHYRYTKRSLKSSVEMQVRQSDGSYKTTYTRKCSRSGCLETGSASADVNVAAFSGLYLQFNVLSGGVGTYKSNNANQAGQMYISNYPPGAIPALRPIQARQTEAVDIYKLVPCGMESRQSWEDGGSGSGLASDADFHYYVTGRCTGGGGSVRLTQ